MDLEPSVQPMPDTRLSESPLEALDSSGSKEAPAIQKKTLSISARLLPIMPLMVAKRKVNWPDTYKKHTSATSAAPILSRECNYRKNQHV